MAKSKKDGGQRYDWDLIRQEYIQDPKSTHKKLAEKFGVAYRTVQERSRTENWLATKKEYQKKIAEKVAEKVAEKIAENRAEAIEIGYLVATDLINTLKEVSANAKGFRTYIVNESAPAPEGIGVVSVTYAKELEKINLNDVNTAAKALKTTLEALGSVSPDKKSREDREWERFRWEQEQAEKREREEELDKDITIRIGGFTDDWSR